MILITGSAGGLGRALVETFARDGWRVAAGWHRTAPPPETESTWAVRLDVTNRAQIRNAAADVVKRWKRIDLLINNAGITADQLMVQTSEADWDRVLDVNLKGAFLCSQAVTRTMLRQRNGHIINIASFAGRVGSRGQAAYAAAKAGLIGLTRTLARELGAGNVRVNAVLPGVLPTPLTAGLSQAARRRYTAATALGRLNSVDEVARFIVFLASLQNVSGQLFQLDSRIAP